MSITDYLIDSSLVLLVLLQIRERELTMRAVLRPLIIVAVAVANYVHGIPTAGNDLVLILGLALTGGLIGILSGQAVLMRRGRHGEVLARSGWLSSFYWVLGMGSRFAFVFWLTHWGGRTIAQWGASHSITSFEAWTVALLAMAAFEVAGRSAVLAWRRHDLQRVAQPELV
ncbi:MAG TPA: hypothetical protein VG405_08205 [Solirubrobacteraceae bacterium]|nr:hypothetical protein [Solirubrobacteraceae bacterium]